MINEFDVVVSDPEFETRMALLDRLQADKTPLDGIGFQLHLFASYDQFDACQALQETLH